MLGKEIELKEDGPNYRIDEKYIGKHLFHIYESPNWGKCKMIIKVRDEISYDVVCKIEDTTYPKTNGSGYSFGNHERVFELDEYTERMLKI